MSAVDPLYTVAHLQQQQHHRMMTLTFSSDFFIIINDVSPCTFLTRSIHKVLSVVDNGGRTCNFMFYAVHSATL